MTSKPKKSSSTSFLYPIHLTPREIEVLYRLTHEEAERLTKMFDVDCPKGCLMDVTLDLDTKLTTHRNRISNSHVRSSHLKSS